MPKKKIAHVRPRRRAHASTLAEQTTLPEPQATPVDMLSLPHPQQSTVAGKHAKATLLSSTHHMSRTPTTAQIQDVHTRLTGGKTPKHLKEEHTYGELLPDFVGELLAVAEAHTGDVVLDIGSGVGNVVFQAATLGHPAVGVEIATETQDLAFFNVFGMVSDWFKSNPGGNLDLKLHLADATRPTNSLIEDLRRADIFFINNKVFGPTSTSPAFPVVSPAAEYCSQPGNCRDPCRLRQGWCTHRLHGQIHRPHGRFAQHSRRNVARSLHHADYIGEIDPRRCLLGTRSSSLVGTHRAEFRHFRTTTVQQATHPPGNPTRLPPHNIGPSGHREDHRIPHSHEN